MLALAWACANSPSEASPDAPREAEEAHSDSPTADPVTWIADLPHQVRETSGLAWAGERLLTHNDRGGDAALYAVDLQTGEVTDRISISGVRNVDWEELSVSEDHVHIADIGNNRGDRTDLAIHRVSRACLAGPAPTACPALDTLTMHYPEQDDFETRQAHNFDAEAMVHHDDHLWIFTKHRLDGETVAYRIPDEPGDHAAERVDTFPAGGRVTGAELVPGPHGPVLVLVGYNKTAFVFLWTFDAFSAEAPFGGDPVRHELGRFRDLGQVEAIVHDGEGGLWMSAESVDGQPARLYHVDLEVLERRARR